MAIKPAEVIDPDEIGWWNHPDLPLWEEDTPLEDVDKWQRENAITLEIVEPKYDEELTFDEDYLKTVKWEDARPCECAFLLAIYDTEDGPRTMWAIPDGGVA